MVPAIHRSHGCQNGQQWLGSLNHTPFEYNVDFYEPRATNHGLFHEPRVTRGDVVTLNLLPRSGI